MLPSVRRAQEGRKKGAKSKCKAIKVPKSEGQKEKDLYFSQI